MNLSDETSKLGPFNTAPGDIFMSFLYSVENEFLRN